MAKPKGLVIGYAADESPEAPHNTLTTTTVDYGKVIFEAVQRVDNGTITPTVYVETFKNGVFGLLPAKNIPAAVAAKIAANATAIEAGKYHIAKPAL